MFNLFLHPLALALSLAAVALTSGTGLVQASSTALPGENLYPVKRTWEDVRLLFVFTPEIREAVEGGYEQERLDEVAELLREGRVVSITFSGVMTESTDSSMTVSGVPVAIDAQTAFSGTPLAVGAAVIVTGRTDSAGRVTATEVQVLPPGAVVPTGEMEETENDAEGSPVPSSNESQEQPGAEAPSSTFHIEGTVQSMDGSVWVIDGRTVYAENPALLTLVTVGMRVEVKGYFASDGRFIVLRVEIEDSSSHQDGTSATKDSDSSNENSDADTNENDDDGSSDNQDASDNEDTNDNGDGNENDGGNETLNDNNNETDNENSNDNTTDND